jgi:hypothetical protein
VRCLVLSRFHGRGTKAGASRCLDAFDLEGTSRTRVADSLSCLDSLNLEGTSRARIASMVVVSGHPSRGSKGGSASATQPTYV